MNRYVQAYAQPGHLPRRGLDRSPIRSIGAVPERATHDAPGLDFVHDAIVGVPESRHDRAFKLSSLGAGDVDGGEHAGVAAPREQASRASAVEIVGLIERREQQQVSQMKNPAFERRDRHVINIENRVGSPQMKERAGTGLFDRHHVGVARLLAGTNLESGDVGRKLPDLIEDPSAVVVVTHEPDRFERKRSIQSTELDQHVERRSAGPHLLAKDVGQHPGVGPDVDDLQMIDNPGSGQRKSAASLVRVGAHC